MARVGHSWASLRTMAGGHSHLVNYQIWCLAPPEDWSGLGGRGAEGAVILGVMGSILTATVLLLAVRNTEAH